MPRRYPREIRRQVVELARAGTRVAQLAVTFGMSEATIYNWLRQEQIDRGEIEGLSTDQAIELAAARRRIRQLETELAVSRKVNEVFLDQGLAPKPLPGDRGSDRAGHRRAPRLPHPRRVRVGVLCLEDTAGVTAAATPDLAGLRDRRRRQGVGGHLRCVAGHGRAQARPRNPCRPQRGIADHA
jgi:transposase